VELAFRSQLCEELNEPVDSLVIIVNIRGFLNETAISLPGLLTRQNRCDLLGCRI